MPCGLPVSLGSFSHLCISTVMGKLWESEGGLKLGACLGVCLKADCCCKEKRTHELYKLPSSIFQSFNQLFFSFNRLHCLENR